MRKPLALSTLSLCLLLSLVHSSASAYREYFTPEQKAQLEKIQTVLIDVMAITDKDGVETGALADVVAQRLNELGYAVVRDPLRSHDVVLRMKCEQRKTWEGTTATGGDADLPDAPSRLWKGPACQLTYRLGGMKIKWQKEVRTEFDDAVVAAQAAQADDPGRYAMAKLHDALGKYEFRSSSRRNGAMPIAFSRCWIRRIPASLEKLKSCRCWARCRPTKHCQN